MAKGVPFVTLEGPRLFLDGLGNLVLGTSGAFAEQIAAGNQPGLIGVGVGVGIAISYAKGAANIVNVTFQLTDSMANALAKVASFDFLLSDAATGIGLTATTASGGFAAVTGAILTSYVASKFGRAQTDATGKFVLAITDTAKTGFYPAAQIALQSLVVGPQLVAANYGP